MRKFTLSEKAFMAYLVIYAFFRLLWSVFGGPTPDVGVLTNMLMAVGVWFGNMWIWLIIDVIYLDRVLRLAYFLAASEEPLTAVFAVVFMLISLTFAAYAFGQFYARGVPRKKVSRWWNEVIPIAASLSFIGSSVLAFLRAQFLPGAFYATGLIAFTALTWRWYRIR